MQFEFATATRILFGSGTIKELGKLAAEIGHRVLLVTGKRGHPAVLDLLTQHQLEVTSFIVDQEPTLALIQAGLQHAADCQLVIGVGGGSVLDAGKAIAALVTNPGNPIDYLEVIGQGKPLQNPPLPYIAIPTTAGTGSEVTRNAVLGSPEHQVKVSLRSPLMLPHLALIDPKLALDLPPAVTASTGMDALTQLIEPFTCNKPNPLTDALCREGMVRAARFIRRAYQDGHDLEARENMAVAALFSGLALANAKLGAVHGFAGPFGGMFSAPHGAVCAALLPHVTAVNIRALQERGDHRRYQECAFILTATNDVKNLIRWLEQLSDDLQIPGLATYGFTRRDFPALIEKASRASSMQGNAIPLTPAEMETILDRAL